MSEKKPQKPPRGRPPKVIQGIPDTFENVIRAIVSPAKKGKPKPD